MAKVVRTIEFGTSAIAGRYGEQELLRRASNVLEELTKIFGNATLLRVQGSYLHDGDVIKEDAFRIDVVTNEDMDAQLYFSGFNSMLTETFLQDKVHYRVTVLTHSATVPRTGA